VRSKALVQYFSPYVTVDMAKMAAAFNADVDALEKELAQLIMSRQIAARIDSQRKVLHARNADARASTFEAAVKMGDEYLRETRALVLRINMMRADFVVRGAGEGPGLSAKSSRHRSDAAGAYASEVGM
jgi:COP9 signalosome complex subunit 1